jgi:tetratricopeptide (TPR) repeat protein
MDFAQRESNFKRALKLYREGCLHMAAGEFRLLIEDGSTDPRHRSYYGLLMAIVEKQVSQGLRLCEQAVEEAFYDTDMYLNLAVLYFRTGRRGQASEVLLRGLRIDPDDPALLKKISQLNPRSTPTFPFLSRKHLLNKYLGLAKSRLFHLAA